MRRLERARQMTQGLLLTVIGWLLLVVVALWRDARWPEGIDHWYTFGVVALVIEFLLIKSWLMSVRAWIFDRLTAALTAANVMFAVVYLWLFVILPFWPSLRRASWEDPVRHGLLTVLALVLLWGLIEFWKVPDPPDDDV